MSNTQQPEALNLEEFRAKVTRTAREPLLARIAELEAVLSAMGEKGNPVEPADIPRATDQDTHFFLAGWNGRAAQVDPHEHFRNAAATAPAYPAEGMPEQTSRDAVIQHLTSAGVLEHDGCGIFIASGDASELIDACMAISATHPTTQGLDAAVRELIDRLQDAQQDINLAANTHMSQQLASAAALLDEVESTLRTLSATQPAAQGMDAQTLKHISALSELVRMPNAEHFADAHNAAVLHLRALAAQAKQGGQANG